MDKKEVSETVSGILLLYLFVTNVFALLSIFSNLFLPQITFRALILYCYVYWIVLAALIVAALIFYRKKHGQPVGPKLLDNETTCKTAGLLILADGVIGLSTTLPGQIYSVITTYQFFRGDLGYPSTLAAQETRYITVSVIIDLFAVCQILLGLFIAKRHGKKDGEPPVETPDITE